MIRGDRGVEAGAGGTRLPARIVSFITILAAVLLVTPSSPAALLTWDSGGASAANPVDGSGTWDTSTPRWSNGSTDSAWNNANNDIAVFGNGNGTAGLITLGEAITNNGLTFNAATSGNYIVTNNTLTLSGASPLITVNADATIVANLAGTSGFVKAGAGKLTLGGTNGGATGALSGILTLSEGTVAFAAAVNLLGASGTSGKIALNGGVLQLAGATGYISVGRGLILTTTGGALDASSGTGYGTFNVGTVSNAGSGPRTLTLTGTSTGNSTFQGVISDGTGGATALTKEGSTVWILNSANTYTGNTTINAGSLYVSTVVNPIPIASTVYIAKPAILGIDTSQTIGNLQDGAGGGGTVRQMYTGSNVVSVQAGAFSGVLKDGGVGRILHVAKTTGGTLILSGTNTYSGGTAVSGGMLVVNGVLPSNTVTVAAGAALSGTGTVYGTVILAPGAAAVNLTNGVSGTLTLTNGLTLDNGNVMTFDVGATADKIALTGGPFTKNAGDVTVIINATAGFTAGSYDLITGAGIASTNGYTLATTVSGFLCHLAVSGGKLQLVVVHDIAPVAFWKGSVGSSWGTIGNWATDSSGAIPVTQPVGLVSEVTFTTTDATHLNTVLDGSYTIDRLIIASNGLGAASIAGQSGPETLTLLNGLVASNGASPLSLSNGVVLGASQAWTNNAAAGPITIAAAISGVGKGLLLAGAGPFVLAGASTYDGGTTNAGTLQLGDGATSNGSLVGSLVNHGTLVIANPSDLVSGMAISGVGTVIKTGAGTLTLSGANTGSGATTISNGCFRAGSSAALSSNSAVTLVDAVTTSLDLNDFNNTVASLAGGGTTGGNVQTGTGAGGLLTNGGNHASTTYAGVMSGNGGLVKVGSGTLILTGANTYMGATAVNAGKLVVNNSLASSAVTVASGAELRCVNTLSGSLTLQAGAAVVSLTNGVAGDVLTVANGLTLNPGNVLNFDLGVTADRIAMTGGSYTKNAGTVTINITTQSGFTTGTNDLITTSGGITSPAGFVLGASVAGNKHLALISDGLGKLQVVVFDTPALTWDSGGTSPANPADGPGTWDTSTVTWSDGSTDWVWNNAGHDIAVFGHANGAAGVVTLAEPITAGGLTFNAPGSGSYVISNSTLTLEGELKPVVSANAEATLVSAIAGTNGFEKTGGDRLILAGATTLTGTMTLSAGTVAYSALGNLLAATGRIQFEGGTLQFTNGVGYNSINRGMILSPAGGTLEDTKGGSAGNDYAAYTPGVVSNSGSGSRLFTLTGTTTEGTSFQGILTDGPGGATSLTKDGTGYWNLNGNVSTYTGDTTIKAGNLRLDTNAIPAASTVRLAKAGTLNIGCNNQVIGNLQDGTGGGGTIMQLYSSGVTFILAVQSGSFSGVMKDSTTTRMLGLTKTTGGTLTLSGTNSFTGPTLVNAGTLFINGVSTGSAVSVNSGATLGGSGKIYGAVTTVDTTSHVAPGNGVGTLTVGALDASGGANFVFEVGASQDLLAITGAFTGSSAANGLVFDFSKTSGLIAGTPYTLISFGSVTGLDYADLLARVLPQGYLMDTNYGGAGTGFQINANSLQVQFAPEPRGCIYIMR